MATSHSKGGGPEAEWLQRFSASDPEGKIFMELTGQQQIRMWAVEAAIKAQIVQPSQIVDAARKFADFTEGKTVNNGC